MQRLILGDKDISNSLKIDGKYVNVPFNQPFSASLLLVGGGGGGEQSYEFRTDDSDLNRTSAGAGGAGGMVYGDMVLDFKQSFDIEVGLGGVAGEYAYSTSTSGSRSIIEGSGSFEVTAFGGGKGGEANAGAPNEIGGNGGSGGGGGGDKTTKYDGGIATSGSFTGGSITAIDNFQAFGNDGGIVTNCTGQQDRTANSGGGGAGGAGSSTICNSVSGIGRTWPVNSLNYAIGGGNNSGVSDGFGFGGNDGSLLDNNVPVPPVQTDIPALRGSNGTVIIAYDSAADGGPKATGGTITQAGGTTYHTFLYGALVQQFFVYKTI